MPDSWTLVTPEGDYALNPTFAATTYTPGQVDRRAAARRDDSPIIQRVGDGLTTPGPLTLNGAVWRDDQDAQAIAAELRAIQEAVRTCTGVVRTNQAGTYTYGGLAGGPTIAVTPDGLGGWRVRIDLWPATAQPTFVPVAPPGPPVDVLAAAIIGLDQDAGTLTIPIPDAPHPAGSLVILALYNVWFDASITAASGLTNLNGLGNNAPLVSAARGRLWAYRRTLGSGETTLTLTSGTYAFGTAHITVLGGGNVGDVHAAIVDSVAASLPGTATVSGRQVFMGTATEYINT